MTTHSMVYRFHGDTVETLDKIAKRFTDQCTRVDAVKRAVYCLDVVTEAISNGETVVIKDKNGQERKVVI